MLNLALYDIVIGPLNNFFIFYIGTIHFFQLSVHLLQYRQQLFQWRSDVILTITKLSRNTQNMLTKKCPHFTWILVMLKIILPSRKTQHVFSNNYYLLSYTSIHDSYSNCHVWSSTLEGIKQFLSTFIQMYIWCLTFLSDFI